jgi:HK97 family phage portal protein
VQTKLGIVSRIKSALGFGAVNPTMEGGLPVSWQWNWWQQDLKPLGSGMESAIKQACINAYAQTIASLWAGHYRKLDNGGKERVENSPLAAILRKPNAYQTRSDFILNLIWCLMETGNAYAIAERTDTGRIVALHLLHSRNCAAYIDAETGSVFYSVGGNPFVASGMQYMIPSRDILHIRLHAPVHPLIVVSPLMAAALALAANSAISAHQAAFFGNMARPSGILTTDANLTRPQIDTLREAWRVQSQGLNSGGVPILSNGLKWQGLSINSQDAQLVAAFNMTVEDVARAFRVPLPIVGSYQQSTYNNVEQLISLWMATGLGFVLEHLEQSFDAMFELPPDQFCEFDTDTLLRTDFAGRIEALTKGISGGLYAPNEARAKEGLKAVEFGDEPRVQAQVVPLSQVGAVPATPSPAAAPAPSPPVDDDKDDPEEAKAYSVAYETIKRAMHHAE